MEKNKLTFYPVKEKPNPSKMIFLSIRVDGKSKTRIDAQINMEERCQKIK